MSTIPDLIPLHDSRRGVRRLLEVAVSESGLKRFLMEAAEGTEETQSARHEI